MSMSVSKKAAVRALCLGAVGILSGCDRPGGPGTTDEFGNNPVVVLSGVRCPSARSSEPLPARSSVTMPTMSTSNGDNLYFTNVLFDRFKSICGGCHVDGSFGGFVVTQATFPTMVTQAVVDAYIKSDDATKYMPPAGSPNGAAYDSRGPTDPVVQLVGLLELWIAQGSPVGSFQLNPMSGADGGAAGPDAGTDGSPSDGSPSDGSPSDGSPSDGSSDPGPTAALGASGGSATAAGGGSTPASSSNLSSQADYALSPELGAVLTNIGSCIPNKYIVGLNGSTMDQLDTFFAQATQLPLTLDATDLTTFDSDELARNGVISYVPAYPLWSDDAGKMRHVRVPHGQAISFDKTTQQFQIPSNTRFYKTFLKHVIDAGGNDAYKKIETRLIVSRPDRNNPDGTIAQTALFGTYIWDESETTATLLQDPLRSGEPFADRLTSYITDEPKAAAIIASKPLNVDYVLEHENPGLVRHYAIPGSQRCIQCHMGSPSASFVLGFTPLQVATVAPGVEGVIEPATGDELTQLKRLIDYKVISGMTSPADVLPLDQTQLPRTPRTPQELTAQAYMVGNCAHCHNPRGFPSTKAPALKDILNFLPGPNGGIFQFPLDRTSPIRARTAQQDVPIPYITPSLRDYPSEVGNTYTVKYETCSADENDGWCLMPNQIVDFIDAPWRSLIYRNVDTPFDYVDDLAIFPHMPMNTPGYDCRVHQIMGDWMVSIPAVQVDPTENEDKVADDPTGPDGSSIKGSIDLHPQPFVEVKPSDPGYPAAQAAAVIRLATFRAGHRYNYCPDTTDIVDPAVENRVLPSDPLTPQDKPQYSSTDITQLIMPAEGVPDRAHWVVTDATDPPPPLPPAPQWTPRRPDWATALVDHMAVNASATVDQLAQLKQVVDDLETVTLTDSVRQVLTTEVPFGLWKQQPGCDFSGIPIAGSFQGDDRPLWMSITSPPPDPSAPVYMQSPGAAVFTNICINCHGPQGDAKGLLADEISIMTGGDARVANFRIGLFGPTDSPGTNRQQVFSPPAIMAGTGTPDDYGARYMAWMALGGTQKQIPPALLTIVATTPILGAQRSFTTPGTPNMLQLAQQLCTDVLPADINVDNPTLDQLLLRRGQLDLTGGTTDIIGTNGDMELWLRLCALDNRQVVRVVVPADGGNWLATTGAKDLAIRREQSLYWADGYPAGAPVMDHRGHAVSGVTPDNLFPICLQRPTDPTQAGYADAFRMANPVGGAGGNLIPYCPAELFATGPNSAGVASLKWRLAYTTDPKTNQFVYTDAKAWGTRGAINAGLAVFLYIDQLSKGMIAAKPPYNQCGELNMSSTN
jgi:mono/diheme cytochrome c family protein